MIYLGARFPKTILIRFKPMVKAATRPFHVVQVRWMVDIGEAEEPPAMAKREDSGQLLEATVRGSFKAVKTVKSQQLEALVHASKTNA